jgi:hypothetical protein
MSTGIVLPAHGSGCVPKRCDMCINNTLRYLLTVLCSECFTKRYIDDFILMRGWHFDLISLSVSIRNASPPRSVTALNQNSAPLTVTNCAADSY